MNPTDGIQPTTATGGPDNVLSRPGSPAATIGTPDAMRGAQASLDLDRIEATRVTFAIGDRDSLLSWVRYGYRSQFDGRSREARGRCIPNPADLALVLDVAAAAVRWYESTGVQETARAALAEADAIERLTPGARALLQAQSSFDVEEDG